MLLKNICAFIFGSVLAFFICMVVIITLKNTLKKLLDNLSNAFDLSQYYVRTFIICIVFATLSAILSTPFKFEETNNFMEYVWNISGGLSSLLIGITVILMIFLIILTILIGVLKRNDK